MNLLLTFALSVALVAPDSGSVAFTTAIVWLRDSTTLTSKRVALLPRGAQVRIIQCREQACNIEFRRLQGYVGQELLRSTPATNPVDAGRGYINSKEQWIPSPAQTIDGEAPDGATARCRDGSYSFSQSRRGTCSWHGGVDEWLARSSGGSEFIPLSAEDALGLLQSEHHFSFPILLLQDPATPTR
jgi:Protein of unknown function (DUF3761)